MSSPALKALLIGSSRRFLLLDSNLLLLWITVRYDIRLLRTSKRLQMFSQNDALLLAWIIDQFSGIVTTAHIVTEASNLANALSSYSRTGWFSALASFSTETREETRSLTSLASQPEFIKFGLTDCAIADLAADYQVLTMDHGLSNRCVALGRTALNFKDLRQMI